MLFLSNHIFHQKQMRSPSKIFFDSLQQRLLNLFHQSYNDPRLEMSRGEDRLAQERIMPHVSAENGQPLHKWVTVSCDKLHRQ
jgi:predicted component of type VI protein secretion system